MNQYQYRILYLLLKKYETSKSFKTGEVGLQRPQFAMRKLKDSLAKDYFDEMDYRKKEWIHQAANELEEQNLIEIKWPKDGREIDKIFLQPEAIEEAYKRSGIIPRKKRFEEIRIRIKPLEVHPWEWVRTFWSQHEDALSNLQTAGLQIETPEIYDDLVKTLIYLPQAEEGIMKRVLSYRLFNDTKHFERNVQSRLVSILKRFGNLDLDTDIEVLDAVGIVENPKISLVSGPLLLKNKGEKMNVSNLSGGIGLSFETIEALEIEEVNAKGILLIENLTAYHLYLQGYLDENIPSFLRNPDEVLVIYTGGFPHHALRKFLIKLSVYLDKASNAEVNVFHWGDIDYGGIMIFEHLRKNYFDTLTPILMDDATYKKYVKEGVPFSKEYKEKLLALKNDERYQNWWSLIDLLVDKGLRLEQEGILAV